MLHKLPFREFIKCYNFRTLQSCFQNLLLQIKCLIENLDNKHTFKVSKALRACENKNLNA